MRSKYHFPFTAITAQSDFKLCLLLNLIDPTIGGVLATGDKGNGKTTTVRALSQVMGDTFPFVNLPIGATEDRVLGSVNLEALINDKKTIVDQGLLAQADHGILYIDEVNLLNDYLMDVLLDASATGGYHLEREGVSQWLDSRFCLVGTMNPEEGALRPQLLDRFGLSVSINTPKDTAERQQIAMLRLDFDSDAETFYKRYQAEEQQLLVTIEAAKAIRNTICIPEDIQKQCAALTIAHQVEGMRADILLLKTVRAYAAYLGEQIITEAMLYKIAPFVLAHRSKNSEASYHPDENKDSDETPQQEQDHENDESQESKQGETTFQLPEAVKQHLKLNVQGTQSKEAVKLEQLEPLKSVTYPDSSEKKRALFSSIKHYVATGKFETKYQYLSKKSMASIVFLVDTSASMAIDKQLGYLKGIIQQTIEHNPLQRIQYAIVGLEQNTARVIQGFTSNLNAISESNYKLKVGGKTNLASAFFKVFELLKTINKKTVQLFVLTDGKANTGGDNPFDHAINIYKTYLSKLRHTTIVDTERGFVKLGRARQLAERLRLNYLPINAL